MDYNKSDTSKLHTRESCRGWILDDIYTAAITIVDTGLHQIILKPLFFMNNYFKTIFEYFKIWFDLIRVWVS